MPINAAPLTFASLSGLDWFLIVVVGMSVIAAFRRGIIRVLFSIAGLLAGITLAGWNYQQFADWLHRWITSYGVAEIVSFLTILIALLVLFSVVAGLLRRTAAAVGLGFMDRLLGAVFGLVRGVLAGMAILWAIVAFLPPSTWLENSRLAPYFLAGSHGLSFVVPRQLQEQVAEGTAHLLQQTPEHIRHRH